MQIYNDLTFAPVTTACAAFNQAALLVIDVQKYYADPDIGNGTDESDLISKKIASLAPTFRAAGLKIYAVCWDARESNTHDIDWHAFMPADEDKIIRKRTPSAFESSDLEIHLKQDNIRDIYVCGFNKHACVLQTAEDAVAKKYRVHLLNDLTGIATPCYDAATITQMNEAADNYLSARGVKITTSGHILPLSTDNTGFNILLNTTQIGR